MSYRPDNQSIETPARKIIEGIEEFESAVQERIRSGEWQQTHLADLCDMSIDLSRVKLALAMLAEHTW